MTVKKIVVRSLETESGQRETVIHVRKKYPRVILKVIHPDTGQEIEVVYVRGLVSKSFNAPGIWLAMTREHRNARDKNWRRTASGKRYVFGLKEKKRQKAADAAEWERANASRRKSPRRYLFNKLRKLGAPMDEARRLSGWRSRV